MLPLFLMLKGPRTREHLDGVLVPGMAGIFGIFLVRRYALNVPQDLLEAACTAPARRTFVSVAAAAHAGVTLCTAGLPGQLERLQAWPFIMLTDGDLHTCPSFRPRCQREHAC